MSTITPDIKALRALLDAAKAPLLRHGTVAGDKPGILAGETPVCRVREGAEGAACAALIVGAVNALPGLLEAVSATPASAVAQDADVGGQRQQIEARIAAALKMQPGLAEASIKVFSRLVYAAVEPWIQGGRAGFDASESMAPAPVVAAAQPPRAGLAQARLDAVIDFGNFLLEQGGEDTGMPCPEALEKLVKDWDSAHNAERAGAGGAA